MKSHTVHAIETYFDYLDLKSNNSGYAKESMTAKMGGDSSSGGGYKQSSVPRGVEMTDKDFLLFISRMNFAIEERLRCVDIRAYQYLLLRYQHKVKLSTINELLGCCERTGRMIHRNALGLVGQSVKTRN